MIELKKYNRICPECGTHFTAKRKDKIFCNVNCRVNHHRRHKKELIMKCAHCGHPFYRKRTDSLKLFCSDACKRQKRLETVQKAFETFYKKMKKEGTLKPTIGTVLPGTEKMKKPDYTKKDEIDIWKDERESVKKLKKSIFNE